MVPELFFAELPGFLLTLLARLMEPDPCLMFELIKNKQIVFCPQSARQKRGQKWVRISISHPGTALVGGEDKNAGKKIGVGSSSSSTGPGPGM